MDREFMNIVLIGFRCTGKTSVGQALAGMLKRPFLDTDDLIERRTGQSIDSMIAGYGWDHFRGIEREVVGEVSKKDHLIVATGGGVVLDESNVIRLKRNGLVVWLKGSADVLKERMEQHQKRGKSRPSLTGTAPQDEIEEVLRIRAPLYERAGEITVDVDSLSVKDIAAKIMEQVQERQAG
ncbi:MAG: shikimate kinase [Pseudomonadota bacterium]